MTRFEIKTPVDVGLFFSWLAFEKHLLFHPDDDFAFYEDARFVDYDDISGDFTKLFSDDEINYYNELMDKCFDVCKTYNRDVYQIANYIIGTYHYCNRQDAIADFLLKD